MSQSSSPFKPSSPRGSLTVPSHFWYVASPYSVRETLTEEEALAVREERFREARAFCGWAFTHDLIVFSPIVFCHEIARLYKLPTDAEYWREFNEKFMLGGGGVLVLCIEGWKESKGVGTEIAFAHSFNLPLMFAVPDPTEKYIIRTGEPRQ